MNSQDFKFCNTWDESFFNDFVSLKNSIYQDDDFYLFESIKDFKKLVGPHGVFLKSYDWSAYLILNEVGEPTARFFLTFPKENKEKDSFISMGYFESYKKGINSVCFFGILDHFFKQSDSRIPRSIRGPIQFNFFNGYRLKIESQIAPIFNEPNQPVYYQEIFANLGFNSLESWESFEINTTKGFEKNWLIVEKKWESSGLKVRQIKLSNWKKELQSVFKLLKNSYSDMSEFSDMSWNEFYTIYKDLKYLIQPEFFLLAEDSKKELKAFTIGFIDPLPLLIQTQNKILKKPYLKIYYKLKLLQELKNRKGTLMIPYIGKARGDKSTTWVTAAFGHFIGLAAAKKNINECLLCYNSSKGAMKRLLPTDLKVISKYKLYEFVYEK